MKRMKRRVLEYREKRSLRGRREAVRTPLRAKSQTIAALRGGREQVVQRGRPLSCANVQVGHLAHMRNALNANAVIA